MPATIQCHRFRAPFDGPPLMAVYLRDDDGGMIAPAEWENHLTAEKIAEIQHLLDNPDGPPGIFTIPNP